MKSGFNKQAMKTLGKQGTKSFAKDTYKLSKNSFKDNMKRRFMNFGHSNQQTNGGMEGSAQKVGGLGMPPYGGMRRYPGKAGMGGYLQFSGSGGFKPFHVNMRIGGQQTSF